MTTKPDPDDPRRVDPDPSQETVQRIRDLNERLLESTKSAGSTTLDAYEMALKSMVEFEEKVAGASQLEWVSALAQAHAGFIRDISAAYTKAARELLS